MFWKRTVTNLIMETLPDSGSFVTAKNHKKKFSVRNRQEIPMRRMRTPKKEIARWLPGKKIIPGDIPDGHRRENFSSIDHVLVEIPMMLTIKKNRRGYYSCRLVLQDMCYFAIRIAHC